MIFEAGVVLVVVLWTAGSQPCLCIPQLIIVLQNNADFITLVHITCSRQHQIGSRALEKREAVAIWLPNKSGVSTFSVCMPCTAGKYRESCGDNSVGVSGEPLSLFTTAVHTRTSDTVPHSFNFDDKFSLECSRADVPSVQELTCGCWESCWSTRLRLCRLSLKFARSTV